MLLDGKEVPDELARRLIERLRHRYRHAPCPVPGLERPCRLYVGPTFADGYGSVEIQKDGIRYGFYAHRLSYFLDVGPIPEGLTLDHLCRVRMCAEPKHMDPVSRGENVRRGITHSPEVRARAGATISAVQTGKPKSESHKSNQRAAWTPEKRAALGAKQRARLARSK